MRKQKKDRMKYYLVEHTDELCGDCMRVRQLKASDKKSAIEEICDYYFGNCDDGEEPTWGYDYDNVGAELFAVKEVADLSEFLDEKYSV